jgi:hypothetical protein
MAKRLQTTPDQRLQLVQKVDELKASDPKLSTIQACEQVGVKEGNYYNWKKTQGPKKRKKKDPVLVTSLVKVAEPKEQPKFQTPFDEGDLPPLAPAQMMNAVGEAVGVGVAAALRSLFQKRA